MLQIVKDIFHNYEANRRTVYPEPSVGLYGEQYYKDLISPREKAEFLLGLCPFEAGAKVLDVGCGRGELLFELGRRGAYQLTGIDASQEALAAARRHAETRGLGKSRADFLLMDCADLAFPTGHFDAVVMADLVEHLSHERLGRSLTEVFRVLKPGGRLLIHTEPTVNYKRFGQYFAKYYFKRKGIEWWTPTIREESRLSHVNIQSKSTLSSYLKAAFPAGHVRVFYAPIHHSGNLKTMIKILGLWAIFSPHLWAVAEKP